MSDDQFKLVHITGTETKVSNLDAAALLAKADKVGTHVHHFALTRVGTIRYIEHGKPVNEPVYKQLCECGKEL